MAPRWLTALGTCALLSGCTAGDAPTDGEGATSAPTFTYPEPILPPLEAPTARDTSVTLPEWARALPDAPIAPAPGDKVWATPPSREGAIATTAVYTLEGVRDGLAVLVDTLAQRVERVPGALVHPVAKGKLREGDLALIYTVTTPAWIGVVSRAVRGQEILAKYDQVGTTGEVAVDHAEPLRQGIQPLAFVSYPKARGAAMGLVIALDPTRAWLLTSSGRVDVEPRAALGSLALVARDYPIGGRVLAYRWATGWRPGTVARALEPRLRYEIRLDGDPVPASYFVGALLSEK